jgi:hypothetical protein
MSPCVAKIPAADSHVGGYPFALLSWMCAYVAPAKNTDHMSTGASKYESLFQMASMEVIPPPKSRKLL